MANIIEFFCDFSSPYSYIAAHRIEALGQKYSREVFWKPFLLGAVFQINGQTPLKDQALKWEYSIRDIERCARRNNIDWVLPEIFPIPTQAAGRAFYWINEQDKGVAKNFALKIYNEYFSKGNDIRSKEVVANISEELGMDKKACLDSMDNNFYKEKLKNVTSDAIERKVCGSPFIFIDEEPFWGNDRLDMVDQWLESGGW